MRVSTTLYLSATYAALTRSLAFSPWSTGETPSCADLSLPQVDPSFQVLSISGVEVYNYSQPLSTLGPAVSGLDFCNLTLIITHPGVGDYNIVRVWLPLQGWNGRFQTTGGGGLATGFLDPALAPPIALGYAAGSSDGGLSLNQTIDEQTGAWMLHSNGSVNYGLLDNYSFRATHDVAVIGKALVKKFYGSAPTFSYYTGCSQGGKQGYFAALHNPDDFDGIMANSPAMVDAWATPMFIWPAVVMEETAAPPQCVFSTYLAAMIETCDPLDGVRDGLISDPENCHFDTESLVGSVVNCSGSSVTITSAYAEVVAKTIEGPKDEYGRQLWWGLVPGTEFWGIANTTLVDGEVVPVPFSAGAGFTKYLAFQDPSYDVLNMTYADFQEAVVLAGKYNGSIIPYPFDYSAFRDRGGKLLTWHGMADQYIPHPGSIHFHGIIENNTRTDNGSVDDFLRLFLAPGAGHCFYGGYGPVPTDPLGALVEWVEKGVAPDVLPAAWSEPDNTTISRDLCAWPKVATYNGQGDVMVASSFSCK